MRRLISLTSLAVCKDNAFDFEVGRGNRPMLGNELKAPYRPIFFFIIHFYAIVHRRTIIQNKIISIICSCSFLSN